MKKTNLFAGIILAGLVMLLAPMKVNAESVCKIGENEYESLGEAAEAAKSSTENVTIVMQKDVDLTSKISVTSNNITLDLNGYTLSGPGSEPVLDISSASFVLEDSSAGQTGKVIQKNSLSDVNYACIIATAYANLTVKGGTIIGDGISYTTEGGIYADNSTVIMEGGSITGFYAIQGGVYLWKSKLELSGNAMIFGNTAGESVPNNVYVDNGSTVKIVADSDGNGYTGKVGITLSNDASADCIKKDDDVAGAENVYSDAPDDGKTIGRTSVIGTVIEFAVPVAKIDDKEYGSVADAFREAKAGDTVKMIADSNETQTIRVKKGTESNPIILDLCGYTIVGNEMYDTKVAKSEYIISINAGCLTMKDSSEEGTGKITRLKHDNDCLSGIVLDNDAIFNMEGGTISNTSGFSNVQPFAGGVAVIDSTFNMSGGCIENCLGKYTGGVLVYSTIKYSIFNFSGGIIKECVTDTDGGGGGIYVARDEIDSNEKSRVYFSGGSIVGCKDAFVGGGGVRIDAGDFIMTGGSIVACTSTMPGGAIHAWGFDEFPSLIELSGGNINGCTAENGGGVYIEGKVDFSVGGTVNIVNNSNLAGKENNVVLADTATMDLCSDLSGNVGLSGDSAYNAGSTFDKLLNTENYAGVNNIFSDADTTLALQYEEGTIKWINREVAQIEGGAQYATVNNAMAHAKDGDKVCLLTDAKETSSITVTGGTEAEPIELYLDKYILKGNGKDSVIVVEKGAFLNIEAKEGGDGTGTITQIRDDFGPDKGGAIYNKGTLQILNGVIDGCNAVSYGGGIFNDSGAKLILSSCEIKNCTAGTNGGGIYNLGNILAGNSIDDCDCVIENNKVEENINNLYLATDTKLEIKSNISGSIGIALHNAADGSQFATKATESTFTGLDKLTCDNNDEYIVFVDPDDDTKIIWKLASYKVSFDSQNHGTAPTDQNVSTYGFATKPSDLTEEGYIFGGWYKDAACSISWDFVSEKIISDTVIYAKWTEDTSQKGSGGENGSGDNKNGSDDNGKGSGSDNGGNGSGSDDKGSGSDSGDSGNISGTGDTGNGKTDTQKEKKDTPKDTSKQKNENGNKNSRQTTGKEIVRPNNAQYFNKTEDKSANNNGSGNDNQSGRQALDIQHMNLPGNTDVVVTGKQVDDNNKKKEEIITAEGKNETENKEENRKEEAKDASKDGDTKVTEDINDNYEVEPLTSEILPIKTDIEEEETEKKGPGLGVIIAIIAVASAAVIGVGAVTINLVTKK